MATEVEAAQAKVKAAQEALWAAEQAAEDVERARNQQKHDAVFETHNAVLGAASGFRAAVLKMHAPHFDPDGYGVGGGTMLCAGCTDIGRWDHAIGFPCPTYELARDWNDG